MNFDIENMQMLFSLLMLCSIGKHYCCQSNPGTGSYLLADEEQLVETKPEQG